MGTFVWLYSARTNSPHLIMNSFVVFTTLLAAACAAPQTLVQTVNEGPQTGPLTGLVGGLVQTPKGLRSLELEGFSEDLNQDGFVDPVAPAVPAPVVAPAPIPHCSRSSSCLFPSSHCCSHCPQCAPTGSHCCSLCQQCAPTGRSCFQHCSFCTSSFQPCPCGQPSLQCPSHNCCEGRCPRPP